MLLLAGCIDGDRKGWYWKLTFHPAFLAWNLLVILQADKSSNERLEIIFQFTSCKIYQGWTLMCPRIGSKRRERWTLSRSRNVCISMCSFLSILNLITNQCSFFRGLHIVDETQKWWAWVSSYFLPPHNNVAYCLFHYFGVSCIDWYKSQVFLVCSNLVDYFIS